MYTERVLIFDLTIFNEKRNPKISSVTIKNVCVIFRSNSISDKYP